MEYNGNNTENNRISQYAASRIHQLKIGERSLKSCLLHIRIYE